MSVVLQSSKSRGWDVRRRLIFGLGIFDLLPLLPHGPPFYYWLSLESITFSYRQSDQVSLRDTVATFTCRQIKQRPPHDGTKTSGSPANGDSGSRFLNV